MAACRDWRQAAFSLEAAHPRLRDGPRNLAVAFALVAGLFLILSVAIQYPVGPGLVLSAMALLLVHDHRYSLRGFGLIERGAFLHWIRRDRVARIGMAGSLVFILSLGATQLALVERFGGLEPVFQSVGLMYRPAAEGEYWRLLSGPYLHYSLSHYAINAAMLVIIGWVAFAVRPVAAVATFVSGCSLAALAQWQLGGQIYDSMGGISGGVFALFGFVAASGLFDRRALPRGLAWHLAGLAVISILYVEVSSDTVATTAHVAGLLWGTLVAAALHVLARLRT